MNNKYVITVFTALLYVAVILLSTKIFSDEDASKTIKVGFVYSGDLSSAYTKNFIRTQEELEAAFGERIQTFVKHNISENGSDCVQAIEELVQEGCNLIFTTVSGYGLSTKQMAAKYPSVQFCNASGDLANQVPVLPNFHNFMGMVYQARYICGVVAGLKLKELLNTGKINYTNAKIGYVASFPVAEVISGYTAFFMGVRSVVPEAEMSVLYTRTKGNHKKERQAAERLINEGCVIISQHSGSTAVAMACENASSKNGKIVFHTGYIQSMTDVAPTTSLVSCRINWTPYVIGATQAVLKGKKIESAFRSHIEGNDVAEGFYKDWIEIIGLNKLIAARGSEEKIESLKKQFKAGNIDVFAGNYVGVNPENENDVWNLQIPYIENEKKSAPSFCYELYDVIKCDTMRIDE